MSDVLGLAILVAIPIGTTLLLLHHARRIPPIAGLSDDQQKARNHQLVALALQPLAALAIMPIALLPSEPKCTAVRLLTLPLLSPFLYIAASSIRNRVAIGAPGPRYVREGRAAVVSGVFSIITIVAMYAIFLFVIRTCQ